MLLKEIKPLWQRYQFHWTNLNFFTDGSTSVASAQSRGVLPKDVLSGGLDRLTNVFSLDFSVHTTKKNGLLIHRWLNAGPDYNDVGRQQFGTGPLVRDQSQYICLVRLIWDKSWTASMCEITMITRISGGGRKYESPSGFLFNLLSPTTLKYFRINHGDQCVFFNLKSL